MNLKSIRNILILTVIVFGLLITWYVSIPDYPYNAHAWEVMLWGESSQWWSEVCWIALFCLFSIFSIYLISWNHTTRSNKTEQYWLKVFRCSWLSGAALMMLYFTVEYFRWTTWEGFILNDDTGYLHGIFYLLTFFIGLLAFGEGISYFSKLHRSICQISMSAERLKWSKQKSG